MLVVTVRVGAVECEVARCGELGLDAVEPRPVRWRVSDLPFLELFAHSWCDLSAEEADVLQEGRMRHRAHAVFEIEAASIEGGHGLDDASGDGLG